VGSDGEKIFDSKGRKIIYFVDVDNDGKIYDKTNPKRPIYTGLIMDTDDVIISDDSVDEPDDSEEIADNSEETTDDTEETMDDVEEIGKSATLSPDKKSKGGSTVHPNIYPSGKIYIFKNSNVSSNKKSLGKKHTQPLFFKVSE
jgi:hypothetical protein